MVFKHKIKLSLVFLGLLSIAFTNLSAQQLTFNKSHLESVNVSMSVDSLDGKAVVKILRPSNVA